MPGAQGKGCIFIGILENLLQLPQCRRGADKAQASALGIVDLLPAQSQTKTVYGHHGDVLGRNLKFAAGLNGTGLILTDGENGAGDHILQDILGHINGLVKLDIRQIGIIIR